MIKAKRMTGLVIAGSVLAAVIWVQGQGSLKPPGPPAPTMKTLDQVEPRIPINEINTPGDATAVFKITQPGSYYLTGNLQGQSGKHGITIGADNVAIDLCGFTMQGTGAGFEDAFRGAAGIHNNIVIRNGIIRGWSGAAMRALFVGGVDLAVINNCSAERLLVTDNGAGFVLGTGSIIECIALNNRSSGLLILMKGVCRDNVAVNNHGDGIYCAEGSTIENCLSCNNGGLGIFAQSHSTIVGCTMTGNTNGGAVVSESLMRNCTISGNQGFGIQIISKSDVRDCLIANNQGGGIIGENLGENGCSRIQGNNICGNSIGIALTNNSANFIYANTLRDNTVTNLYLGTGNSAPVSSDPATAGPWHNIVL